MNIPPPFLQFRLDVIYDISTTLDLFYKSSLSEISGEDDSFGIFNDSYKKLLNFILFFTRIIFPFSIRSHALRLLHLFFPYWISREKNYIENVLIFFNIFLNGINVVSRLDSHHGKLSDNRILNFVRDTMLEGEDQSQLSLTQVPLSLLESVTNIPGNNSSVEYSSLLIALLLHLVSISNSILKEYPLELFFGNKYQNREYIYMTLDYTKTAGYDPDLSLLYSKMSMVIEIIMFLLLKERMGKKMLSEGGFKMICVKENEFVLEWCLQLFVREYPKAASSIKTRAKNLVANTFSSSNNPHQEKGKYIGRTKLFGDVVVGLFSYYSQMVFELFVNDEEIENLISYVPDKEKNKINIIWIGEKGKREEGKKKKKEELRRQK
jgi:hypothetical protein